MTRKGRDQGEDAKQPSRFLNKSQGEEIFKQLAGVERFENELWEHIQTLCFDYFVILAKEAGERVKADGRTVIDIADVGPPEGAGSKKVTVESLMEKLHALADDDVSQVIRFRDEIKAWVTKVKES